MPEPSSANTTCPSEIAATVRSLKLNEPSLPINICPGSELFTSCKYSSALVPSSTSSACNNSEPVSIDRKSAGQLTSDLSKTELILAPVSSDVAVCADKARCANKVKPSVQSAPAVDKPDKL